MDRETVGMDRETVGMDRETVGMDRETAEVLFREGATFVLLGMPQGSEFGIDYNSWTVGPKFRGVKMIPPGLHFIYYSSHNELGGTGPRSGFFYNFKQRDVLLRTWDNTIEDVSGQEPSAEEVDRISTNMMELDQYLGAYPYEHYKKWVSMTSHVTEELVQRLQPDCKRINSVKQFKSEKSNTQSRQEQQTTQPVQTDSTQDQGELARLPPLEVVPGTDISFTSIPKQRYPLGATPREITKHSLDSTYTLTSLLDTYFSCDNKEILGEIQFSFICFLIGQVYDAFDQWKHLVNLMCTCLDALLSHQNLFMEFITMLHFQVHEIPEDFFVDIVSSNNFLTTTLQQLFENLDDLPRSDPLRQRGRKFCNHLTRKFNWNFQQEPDDCAPIVVETTD